MYVRSSAKWKGLKKKKKGKRTYDDFRSSFGSIYFASFVCKHAIQHFHRFVQLLDTSLSGVNAQVKCQSNLTQVLQPLDETVFQHRTRRLILHQIPHPCYFLPDMVRPRPRLRTLAHARQVFL